MERLMTPAEVASVLGYKDTEPARRIMRQMVHMEKPLRVTERALQGWINQRMQGGGTETETRTRERTSDRIPRRGRGACRDGRRTG